MVIAISKEKGLESMIAKEGEAILNKETQFHQNINSSTRHRFPNAFAGSR
jgi:hypothetical protein